MKNLRNISIVIFILINILILSNILVPVYAINTDPCWRGCGGPPDPTPEPTTTPAPDPPAGNKSNMVISKGGSCPTTGTITDNLGGINCGSKCSWRYNTDNGNNVTLTTTVPNGCSFAGFSGCISASGQNCYIILDQGYNINATYNIVPNNNLTVNVSAGGGVTDTNIYFDCTGPNTCSKTLSGDTFVVLGAYTMSGYHFVGWGGDCGGTGVCRLPMNSSRYVTATFAADIVSPPSCDNSCAALTCSGSTCTNTCGQAIAGTRDCTPVCNPDSSCAANTCSGSTCQDACGNRYNGTRNCTAPPPPPPACVPNNSCAANTCIGNQCINNCNQPVNGTRNCSSPPPAVCNYNGSQDNGETGVDCGGGNCPACVAPPPSSCSNGANNPPWCNTCNAPQTFNGSFCVNPPVCVPQCFGDMCGQSNRCGGFCPNFDSRTPGKCGNPFVYTLTVDRPLNGSITGSNGINCGFACGTTVNEGTVINLQANPSIHYRFTGWTGDCAWAGANPNCNVTMNSAHRVGATFQVITHTITVTIDDQNENFGTVVSNPNGINCRGDCSGVYNEGSTLTLTAQLGAGQGSFESWTSGPCSGSSNPICTFTVNNDTVVTAKFNRCGNNVCNGAPWNETEASCGAPVKDCVKVNLTIYKRELFTAGNDAGTCVIDASNVNVGLNGQNCRSTGANNSFYCTKNGQAQATSGNGYYVTYTPAAPAVQNVACPITSTTVQPVPIGNTTAQTSTVIAFLDQNNRITLEGTSIYGGTLPVNSCTGVGNQLQGQQGVSRNAIAGSTLAYAPYNLGGLYTLDSFYDYIRAFKQFKRVASGQAPTQGEVNIYDSGVPGNVTASDLTGSIIYINNTSSYTLPVAVNTARGFMIIAKGTIVIDGNINTINGIIIADKIELRSAGETNMLTVEGNLSARNGIFKGRLVHGVCSNAATIRVDNTIFTTTLLSKLGVRFYEGQKNN